MFQRMKYFQLRNLESLGSDCVISDQFHLRPFGRKLHYGNETGLSIVVSRTQKYAVYHIQIISCTYVYLACKSY